MIKRYAFLIVCLAVTALVLRFGMAADLKEDSTLRALVIPVATVFLDTFNSAATAVALCFLMAAAALALHVYYAVFRIAPVVGDLRTVNDELRSISSGAGSLELVDRLMDRHSLVSRSWNLYRPHISSQTAGTFASVPPERYFGMRMIERSGLRLRFFLNLPNDFVGLGLIFTFLGLVAGLYFASRSMTSPDLGMARNALVQLLHAATFKFLTSITGISLSLLLSWGQGVLLGRLHAELNELATLIEERFPYRPRFSEQPVEQGSAETDAERGMATPVRAMAG